MSKIYILGPMSGYKNFNFEAFNQAAFTLKRQGWTVFNPVNKDQEAGLPDEAKVDGDDKKLMASGWDFRDAYLWDVTKVIEADAVYCLQGWENSAGARGEHAVAVSMKARYPEYKIIYQ